MNHWDPENHGKWHVSAHHDMHDGPSHPQDVEAALYVPTYEEAQRVAGSYPKSIGLHAHSLMGVGEDRKGTIGTVRFRATLGTNGVNHGANETGLKRYGALRKNAQKQGHEVTYSAVAGNSYPTEDDFNNAVSSKTPATDPATLFNDRRSS